MNKNEERQAYIEEVSEQYAKALSQRQKFDLTQFDLTPKEIEEIKTSEHVMSLIKQQYKKDSALRGGIKKGSRLTDEERERLGAIKKRKQRA